MLKIPVFPQGEEESRDFEVFLNDQKAALYAARVSAMPYNTVWPGRQRPLDQTEMASFLSFEADEPVAVRLIAARDFEKAVVRPLSKNVSPETNGREIRFTLPGAGQYTVELDGFHNALHVFVNPPANFGVNKDDPNVLYYGPGTHDAGVVKLKSHQTAYVDAGAVVYGCFMAVCAEDVKVVGYGIVDGSREIRTNDTCLLPYDYKADMPEDEASLLQKFDEQKDLNGCLRFFRCKNVMVNGIVARDAATFSLIPANCENIVIDNYKTIGMWRYNSDGIDLFNCSNCVIQNSFLRNFDDCIVIKGICGWDARNNENIIVRSCVVWCDWGRALEIGAETNAPEYRNIVFENCDVIHGCDLCADIQHHNNAEICHILFQNIRCEYNAHQLAECYQHDMNAPYDASLPGTHPLLMGVYVHRSFQFAAKENYKNGCVHDVLFKDIYVLADEGVPMPVSRFMGVSDEHAARRIRIENVYFNGKRVDRREDANLDIHDFVYDLEYV